MIDRADAENAVSESDMRSVEGELETALDERDTARDACDRAAKILDDIDDTTDAPRTRSMVDAAWAILDEARFAHV